MIRLVLIARRLSDGRYLKLENDGRFTTPEFVDTPEEADWIEKSRWWLDEDWNSLKSPSYYLGGQNDFACEMVKFSISIQATQLDP